LDGGFGEVWAKRWSSSTRTKMRKAERADLTLKSDCSGKFVPIFYELFSKWVEQRAREAAVPQRVAQALAMRKDSLSKIESVAQHLGEACRIYVAWHQGTPIASSIMLLRGATAMYWRSASDKDLAGPLRVNDLIQRVAIEAACSAGFRYYAMGESGGVPSLVHFKERLGAEPFPYTEYRFDRFRVAESLSGSRRPVRKDGGVRARRLAQPSRIVGR
jgi:lipid II:glycine glycyltransferase (peptidoglycan interpeptide bridge formation enzyme)